VVTSGGWQRLAAAIGGRRWQVAEGGDREREKEGDGVKLWGGSPSYL